MANHLAGGLGNEQAQPRPSVSAVERAMQILELLSAAPSAFANAGARRPGRARIMPTGAGSGSAAFPLQSDSPAGNSRRRAGQRRMTMRFEELDETTRGFMLAEFEAEEASGRPYRSRNLSPAGIEAFVELMRQAIRSGTEQTLTAALTQPAYWNPTNPQGAPLNWRREARTLGLTEFNTWYVRGLAKRLLEEGETSCEIYRAADARWLAGVCALHEGQVFPVHILYRGHRAKYWPPPGNRYAISIPEHPGCHHSIRRLRRW